MNKSRRKRIISTLALCAVSATTLMSTGCGADKDNDYTIAVITKQDISFWHSVQDGAEKAGEELGVKVIYNEGADKDYPAGDTDYNTQKDYIDYAIKEGVDAIVIAPNSLEELNDSFAKAEEKGIKIININSRATYSGVLSCISSSDTDGGAVAARHAADAVLGSKKIRTAMAQVANATPEEGIAAVKKLGKGAVGLIGHTGDTANNRIDGFKAETAVQIQAQMADDGIDLDKSGLTTQEIAAMFSKFFVGGENRCGTIDEAYDETKRLLNESPNIVCLFATNTNTTLGACKAVQELGLQETVHIIGFNADSAELDYLRTGVLGGTVVQNPYNMGYFGVRYALKACEDDGIPYSLDTGVTYVTQKNMNDDYIKLLLDPENY
ncbi:MAG: substrate-binding domain-containing protein [Ruminococcus sp.]|nr:substrate-binding domain-containing protein [Ruminococcus sp.]